MKRRAYMAWRETHDGPSVTQIFDRFGGWEEALAAVDVNPARHRKQLPILLPIDGETGSE